MQIKGGLTLENFEELLTKLHSTSYDEILQIPSNVKFGHIGGEASLFQLILTWAARTSPSYVKTHIDEKNLEQIDDFTRNTHSLIAALCCDDIFSINDVSIHSALATRALERLHVLQSKEPQLGSKGPISEVLCADHIGKSYPTIFYRHYGYHSELRSEQEFQVLVEKYLLEKVIPKAYKKGFELSDSKHIGSLIYDFGNRMHGTYVWNRHLQ